MMDSISTINQYSMHNYIHDKIILNVFMHKLFS